MKKKNVHDYLRCSATLTYTIENHPPTSPPSLKIYIIEKIYMFLTDNALPYSFPTLQEPEHPLYQPRQDIPIFITLRKHSTELFAIPRTFPLPHIPIFIIIDPASTTGHSLSACKSGIAAVC